MAETLARAHGVDTGKARVAGMVHDLARLYPEQRLLRECREACIPIDPYAKQHPVVLHAPLSAFLARSRFGIDDPQVLSAVEKHTLAAAQMSRLDCILYLADGLEPGRDFAERAQLAALCLVDLNGAMRATLRASLRYLNQRQLPIAPPTAAAMHSFGLRADALEVRTAGHS